MLESMLALFRPYAVAILADETGETARIVNEMILDGLDDETADWLFDNWPAILDALA